MRGDLGIKFNNKYCVELIDSTTGEVKQSGYFHNTHTKNLWSLIFTTNNYEGNLGAAMVVGKGTTAPTFEDTALASKLWDSIGTGTALYPQVYPANVSYEWLDDYTLRKKFSFTFPATSNFVGNVCEIGLGYNISYSGLQYNTNICTRTLLTDSEGQVITFNKTDLDILVISVTIEASLVSTSNSFILVKRSKILSNILGSSSTGSSIRSSLGNLNLIRFNWSKKATGSLIDRAVSTATAGVSEKQTKDGHNGTYTYPTVRLPATTVTSQTFYNAISVPTLGYWELPNEDIFPTYVITGIAVGTGDGSTTSFINPLNYFKANSEKVYKNGVQLTRDVDYTINNMGNKDCLPEVAQMSPIVKVSSGVTLTNYQLQVYPLIFPVAHGSGSYEGFKSANEYDPTTLSPAFSASYPLYIEYEEPVTMNCLKCTGGLKNIVSPSGYNNLPVGTTMYIDYSTDGSTYIEAGSTQTTAVNGVFALDFADVTAKYWRVRTSYSSYVAMPRDDSNENFLTLNRKDPYIVFAEAPADGDVLTMDVGMDIIMKNSNFVVDLNCTVNFTI